MVNVGLELFNLVLVLADLLVELRLPALKIFFDMVQLDLQLVMLTVLGFLQVLYNQISMLGED